MRTTLAIATMLALAAPLHAQSFFGLGTLQTPDGLGRTEAWGISPDGMTVFGYLDVKNGTSPAFRWTAAGGLESIGAAFEGDTTYPVGSSTDGSVIVGYTGGKGPNRAWRWTASTSYTLLYPLLLDEDAVADAVSGDGTLVAGGSYSPNRGYRVVRWNESGAIQDIGVYPGDDHSTVVRGMTPDGRTIIGWTSGGGLDGMHPYRWTDSEGWELIPMPPSVNGASPNGISADGSVVVGSSFVGNDERTFRWTEASGMELLGVPPGADGSYAGSVSADGNVLVGRAYYDFPHLQACLWTPALGMVNLKDYLTSLGLDLTGWQLESAYGISADGITITGRGTHDGETEGWVAVIPGPATIVLLVLGGAFAIRRRA